MINEVINELKKFRSEKMDTERIEISIPALDSIIFALEQVPALDKIRAEIEQNAYPIVHGVNDHELGMTLYGILQVLDKYKAESEEA